MFSPGEKRLWSLRYYHVCKLSCQLESQRLLESVKSHYPCIVADAYMVIFCLILCCFLVCGCCLAVGDLEVSWVDPPFFCEAFRLVVCVFLAALQGFLRSCFLLFDWCRQLEFLMFIFLCFWHYAAFVVCCWGALVESPFWLYWFINFILNV